MASSVPQPRGTTRDRLVLAATDLFREQGIRATSLEEVAERAGVHRVTLHRTFQGGRDELVAEVLIRVGVEEVLASLRRDPASSTLAELLVATLTDFVVLGRTDPMLREGLCSDAARLAMDPDRLTALYDAAIERREWLNDVAEREELELPHDPRRVADLWARTVLTLVREPGIVQTEEDVRAYVADFVAPGLIRSVAPVATERSPEG